MALLRSRLICLLTVCIVVFVGSMTLLITAHKRDKGTIVVACKNDTEACLLGEIMAQLIEHKTAFKVKRRFQIDGSVCHLAILAEEVDVYPEFTGTALANILDLPCEADANASYEIVKKAYEKRFSMKWLFPFGFENGYTFLARKDIAKTYELKTISDLANQLDAGLRIGIDPEFVSRKEILDIKRDYPSFLDSSFTIIDRSLGYLALAEKELDVMIGYTTDAQICTLDLVALEDDKASWPAYLGAPVIGPHVEKMWPELIDVLAHLNNRITVDKMIRLNYEVEKERKTLYDVAIGFLYAEQLIDG